MKVPEQVKILFAAESPEISSTIQTALSGLGQELVQAHSGPEVLDCLRRDDFAVVLLDVRKSELDGLAIAARMRRRKRCEHTPALLIAHSEDEVRAVGTRGLNSVDCVSLPLDQQVLLNKVNGFIDLFQKTEIIRQQAAHRVQLAREHGARQAAEKALRNSRLLAEASRLLSRSLDFDATLRSIYQAAVPAIADACQLVLRDANSNLWFAPVPAPESTNNHAIRSTSSRVQTVDAQLTRIVQDLFESGRVEIVSGDIVRTAPNLRRKRPWPSAVIAPLVARDTPLGVFICCRRGARRKFKPTEIAVVEDLSGRCATALDNAQLHQTILEGERRKDEFLAMLGHELRNPLAAIANAGELLKMLSPKDPSFGETSETIRQQASLMRRLVDDLLDVSRITSGRVQLQKTSVRADEIVARVAESTTPLFVSRNHALHLSVPEDPICFEADPCRLEQILTNLLVNAAKYTPPGGEVWLSAAREDQDIVFRVKDSGTGIGNDLLPNVFDLFLQANRSLHRSEGGLGIGLTIVKGLTELHGGRVWATSGGVGRGAEFIVCLPAGTATMGQQQPVTTTCDYNAAGLRRRVLVVEDQPALLGVTVALLRKLGHEVTAAADGREALVAVKEHNPEVVFLDIGLPEMDGYEVANVLRTEMGTSAPLLVAMTGYGEQEVKRHVEKARFDHHLVKPADIKAMQLLLSQVG